MIGLIFSFANEFVEIRIDDTNILFRNKQTNMGFTTIDFLQLNKAGCIKENPDLKDRADWREETIRRFKDKIKNMKTENERGDYIKEDLAKYGYTLYAIQKQGGRVRKI